MSGERKLGTDPDQKHDEVLHDQRGGKPENRVLVHTPEAIDEWALRLTRAIRRSTDKAGSSGFS